MATQDMMRDDEAEYRAAFEEDMQPAADPSEDEAFGLTPSAEDAPAGGDAATEGEPAAVAIVVAEPDPAAEEAAEPAAEAAAEPAAEEEEPLDPKEEQRRKSWEGRLRAREEELARREAELAAKAGEEKAEPANEKESTDSEAIEQAAEKLAADGDQEGADAVDQVAEKVESGELSADQAMKILAEDFGPEFVKMIEVIAASKAEAAGRTIAEKATGELRQSVQTLIEDIEDNKARAHFEAIADKHPDFQQVATQPEFAEFAKTYPGGEQIAENGSTKDVIKMLDKFKESIARAEANPEPNPAVDAAEGVRSKGLRLPEAPMKADGYEDAWDQF